ncbi:MAG: efflux RND transporter periplasmic adaptor subunit [Filimonas sp.]|nr:efflux RND transporter periplasmic adaptor subunit [Filimonas sp.]
MKQYLLTGVSIITICLASCHSKKEPVKEESKKYVLSDTMAKMITLDSVKMCNIDNAITLSGEISFNENSVIKIFPRSSGQVVETKVALGDKVQAGQVLAVIKSADVAGSYADLTSANADIEITKRQMDNTEALYKNGIASEKDYTEAKQNYQKALAVKEKIQSTLNINSGGTTKPGGTYVLTAPISGYIVEKKVVAGAFIRPDMADNLFTISDLKDVWVWGNVFESDIPKIKEGSSVAVTTLAYPDKVFNGKIDKMSQVLDPTDKTLKILIKIPNENMMLRPQMFAKVSVSNIENTQAICIPTKALISQNGKNYVVVFNAKDDMKIADVDIRKTTGDKTYLNGGVTPGQKIIVQNELLIFQQLLNENN